MLTIDSAHRLKFKLFEVMDQTVEGRFSLLAAMKKVKSQVILRSSRAAHSHSDDSVLWPLTVYLLNRPSTSMSMTVQSIYF